MSFNVVYSAGCVKKKKKGLLVKTILLNDVYRGRRRLSAYIIAHAGKEGKKERRGGNYSRLSTMREKILYPQIFIVLPKIEGTRGTVYIFVSIFFVLLFCHLDSHEISRNLNCAYKNVDKNDAKTAMVTTIALFPILIELPSIHPGK